MRVALFFVAAALDWPEVLEGVLTGAGLTVELSCVTKAQGSAEDLAAAIALLKSRNATDIAAALKQLGVALETVPATMQACNATVPDVETLVADLTKLKDPEFAKQEAVTIGENLLLNGAAIGQEVILADSDAKAGKSKDFGVDVGTILAKVFAPRPALHKPDWPKVALGAIEGFTGLEGTLEQLCLTELKSEEQQMNAAVQLIREKDAKDVLKGLEQVAEALKGVPTAVQECKNATADAKAEAQKLEQALALMKHPVKFAYHVGKDLVVNGKDILKEIEAASLAYESEQWENFGMDLGEALRELLVGSLLSAAPCEWPQVMLGVLQGAGFKVEVACVEEAVHTTRDLTAAIELLAKKDKKDVAAALKELQQVLGEAPAALASCKESEQNIKALVALLKKLGSPESIAIEVGKNILLNGVPIYDEVKAALADHAAGQCEQMGEEIGEVLHRVFLVDEHHPIEATIVV